MFQPLPMQRIYLKLLTEDTQRVAQALADFGVFNPETLEAELMEQLPHHLGQDFRSAFNSARSRLDKILHHLPFTPPEHIAPYNEINIEQLQQTNATLGDIWQQVSSLEEKQHHVNEQQTSAKQLLATLEKFLNLDLDLGLLRKDKHFLNLHIGTVESDDLQHLTEAVAKAQHFVDVFHQVDDTVYCVVAGPLEFAEDVATVLNYAEFRPLQLPAEFHSHPQQVHDELIAHLTQLDTELETLKMQQLEIAQENQQDITKAYILLHQAAPYAILTDSVRGRGELSVITGWIPKEDLIPLECFLAENLTCPYVLDSRAPLAEERQYVPSLIRHSRFLQSYQTLVQNYGIPRYGEFDPTLLFMVTFLLMFGVMFGDVGQGAVIVGFGWFMRHKLKEFSLFFMAAGVFSIIFGFLYGSVFGVEETIIPALWVSPLHHPFYMLQVALYWGVGFILVMTLLKVVNNWRFGHHAEAVFNSNGLAGIALYLGGFISLKIWMETGVFSQLQQLAIILPLSVVLAYKWYENKLPFGERVLVTLIEGFETLINYLANTLSFLRVAAFSLNHVALAIAIFSIADMMGGVGFWVTAIVGNIVIIVLEGAIVTIQVLRLEYYEGFSRFFSGDGRLFEPLKASIKSAA